MQLENKVSDRQFSGPNRRSESLYILSDVSVNFGNTLALDSINLTLGKGEILFITGASGAGKTTLLRLLAGEIRPSRGTLAGPSVKDDYFATCIFQDIRLIEELTVEENLLFSHDPSRGKFSDFKEELNQYAIALGIEKKLKEKVKNTNGGLKQITALIRALLANPKVVLADEPTSSLDYDNAKRIFNLLNILNVRQGVTVIWASHNRELVKRFNGKNIHLENGRLVYSGHACFI